MTNVRLLEGCEPGRVQTVGYVQIIPIVGVDDDRFVTPESGEFSNNNYGNMTFHNPTDKIMLVPSHMGVVSKKSAQNHAMANAGLVGKNSRREFNNAMCIQESQGGVFERADISDERVFLPFMLREQALSRRAERNYGKLWNEISTMNSSLGVSGRNSTRGHLEAFLGHFKDELDQFVAEFEYVPMQVGALIVMDGQVVGIERYPSHETWAANFEPLIRDCYGSLAIAYAQQVRNARPQNRIVLPESLREFSEIIDVLGDIEKREQDWAKELFDSAANKEYAVQIEDEQFGVRRAYIIAGSGENRYVGDAVSDGQSIVYASTVATGCAF